MCEVGTVRRGIRIVRRWCLNFSMSGDEGRDNAHSVTTREVSWTAGSFFSVLFCSIRRPYITFKLPRRDKDTPLRPRNFFRYQAIGMCHFRSLWNGLCDRRRAEITVIQFTGHSFPVHHWSGTFTLSHIISRAHLSDFFRLLAIGMCHFRYLRNCRCDHHRAEITTMQFIGQSLPVHPFFYGTVRIFTLSHIVSQAVFYSLIFYLICNSIPSVMSYFLLIIISMSHSKFHSYIHTVYRYCLYYYYSPPEGFIIALTLLSIAFCNLKQYSLLKLF